MNHAIKSRPVYALGSDGWNRATPHTATEERLYGAAVFWLYHFRTPREKAKGENLSRLVFGELAGLQVRHLPEARRVYLALCAKFVREPEAITVGELTPGELADLDRDAS